MDFGFVPGISEISRVSRRNGGGGGGSGSHGTMGYCGFSGSTQRDESSSRRAGRAPYNYQTNRSLRVKQSLRQSDIDIIDI